MVPLTINKDNLKVKYILGMYQDLQGYPDITDVMYYLINWSIQTGKSSTEEIQFNDMALCKKFNKNRDEVKGIISKLIDKGWVKHVKDTDIKSVYAIEKNPFA